MNLLGVFAWFLQHKSEIIARATQADDLLKLSSRAMFPSRMLRHLKTPRLTPVLGQTQLVRSIADGNKEYQGALFVQPNLLYEPIELHTFISREPRSPVQLSNLPSADFNSSNYPRLLAQLGCRPRIPSTDLPFVADRVDVYSTADIETKDKLVNQLLEQIFFYASEQEPPKKIFALLRDYRIVPAIYSNESVFTSPHLQL